MEVMMVMIKGKAADQDIEQEESEEVLRNEGIFASIVYWIFYDFTRHWIKEV